MSRDRRLVLLVQLPVPPSGLEPVRGNVPLAAGCLKLFARRQELHDAYDIEILPTAVANRLGDCGLVEAILARQPWMVGFTCYVWNVDRSLWIAQRLKERLPDLKILLGGPEITGDNQRALGHAAVDFAVIGEGEATFVELLQSQRQSAGATVHRTAIDGLWQRGAGASRPRHPLASLDLAASPYLEGVLDAGDERTIYLETMRGCSFKCKFCYYPKGYAELAFLSRERLLDVLRHATERGVEEVVLLDPTLNQRQDFSDFLRLLGQGNPDRRFRFFGELRAEGIDQRKAQLLAEANFTEVEIGLQSIDSQVQDLMGRKNNLAAFERGMHALADAGIQTRVDLIVGLPGDTVDSVRRSIDYLHQGRLGSTVQMFNLSILPGTAFRREAGQLGLVYQRMPPYFVLSTPTLELDQMVTLVEEAQEAFGTEYDGFRQPVLDFPDSGPDAVRCCRVDLDESHVGGPSPLPPPTRRAQAFALWLRSADFHARREEAAALIRQVLDDNPHSTLQVVLEPAAEPGQLSGAALEAFLGACYENTSYLDHFYSLHPGELLGAKRLVVLAPWRWRSRVAERWIGEVRRYATLAWYGSGPESTDDLDDHECRVGADRSLPPSASAFS